MGYYGYPAYESAAEKKEKARKAIEKLKKKNPNLAPITIEGTQIVKSWWGKAWNRNLESYADFSNRISRGRSYVKNGAVLDLHIEKGTVNALVLGSGRTNYAVRINIDSLSKSRYKQISELCNRTIDSLEDLIQGKFPKELELLFTTKREGIFPSPNEIHFGCSCPDIAVVCKHVAATMYAIGSRLDEDPLLFFQLRDIDVEVLIKKSIDDKISSMLKNAGAKSNRAIDDEDIFDLFGV